MLCAHCRVKSVRPPKRKYCSDCSTSASTLWKRRFRKGCRDRGEAYWRDWAPDEERRAYHREYMRRWRAKRRQEARR